MQSFKFNYLHNSKRVWAISSAYQKTLKNGKQIPRNFVYIIHNNEPMILVENRDLISHKKDELGHYVNCEYGPIYYKPATLKIHETENKFNHFMNEDLSKPLLQVEYNRELTFIPPNQLFHIDPMSSNIVYENFDLTTKIIKL